jgi:outer membrane protein OmpA-like peptidoglycan-associated protein/tetratricopeptide (TPR) repeat protein
MLNRILPGEYLSRFTNICVYLDTERKNLPVSFLIILFLLVSDPGFSQGLHSSSKKALKAYSEGLSFFDYIDYKNAENSFKTAVSDDDKFYEAYMMLGELMTRQNRFSEAALFYKDAVKIDSMFYPAVFFSLAEVEFKSGNYGNSLIHYQVYLGQKKISEKNKAIAAKNLKNSMFAVEAMKNPVPFNPVSAGSSINTEDDEYWPFITAEGKTLFFTRQSKSVNGPHGFEMGQEDFYMSTLTETGWQKAINIGPPINTINNEGAQTLSSGGNYMYFTACDRPGGYGSCDIYFSSFDMGKWSIPVNIGPPVNSSFWESQPSISANDKILYFSSNRPGGFGGKDIWYSVMNDNGNWSVPVNMGKTINTEGDEMSPFIHFDGRTLYFASDGFPGMGGFDLYITRMNEDSTWTTPLNLGYPINTFNDEMGLVIESGGQKAFFSSKHDNIHGKDIFWFNLYESIRPNPVSYLKGKVYDKETGKMLKADYELTNLSVGKTAVKSSSDSEGNFLVCLPSGYNYGLNVSKTGYLFYSENFVFEGEHSAKEPFIKRINLSPVSIGARSQLSNVFYEIDSWELKKESVSELSNLVKLLIENKDIIIEIGGYTDSTGSDEYNLTLSEKRARSVVGFLIKMGIKSDRLKFKGYGNQSPVGDNLTSEGRKLNRRTEVKVIAGRKLK